MKAILAKKIGMTKIFDENGNFVPVTLLQAGPCVVTQVKTKDKDGYNAVQLGFGAAKKTNRPLMGHLKAANAAPKLLREIRLPDIKATAQDAESQAEVEVKDLKLEVGSTVTTDMFETGDKVKITGVSKGKGFAGTIKRHNFSRGPKSHGSKSYREPGSIGSIFPMRVVKGQKMAGQMGNKQVTIRGIKIQEVQADKNLLAVRGAVPGPAKGFVVIRGENE